MEELIHIVGFIIVLLIVLIVDKIKYKNENTIDRTGISKAKEFSENIRKENNQIKSKIK